MYIIILVSTYKYMWRRGHYADIPATSSLLPSMITENNLRNQKQKYKNDSL